MSKHKSHKGLLKRIRISKTGKIRHKMAGHKHLRSGKGGKRLEKLLFRRLRGRTQPKASIRKSPSPAQRRAAREAAKAAK